MGKVASTSVYQALKSNGSCIAFHTHVLSPKTIEALCATLKHGFWHPNRQYEIGKSLSQEIIRLRRPAKIITLVRDPFEQIVSAFFENSKLARSAKRNDSQTISLLKEEFLNNNNFHYFINWYQTEFNDALGVDIFSDSFDHQKSWTVIHSEPFDILILRTTLSDTIKSEVISNFLSIDNIKIGRSNQTETKPIDPIYKKFKETLRFPGHISAEIINSQLTQHFFTKVEIDRMREKWG